MSRRGGFGKMNNMGSMMKQMQKMQRELEKAQSEAEEKEFEISVGGGAVVVKANGKKEIISIDIDESVIDPEDKEMLQDLVMSAVNEAIRKAETEMNESMGKLTKGLNIPGL